MESPLPSPFPPDIETHVWRGFRQVSGQLKVGLLMRETDRTERWIARVIWLLVAEPALKLDVVFRLQGLPEADEPTSVLFSMVHRASMRHHAPFEKVSLAVKPACCFVDISLEANGTLADESVDKVKKRKLDVLIQLDSEPLSTFGGDLARLGVWWFRLGEPGSDSPRPPYWSEVVEERPVSSIALLRHTGAFQPPQVICRYVGATEPAWHFTQTAEQMTSIAGPLVLRGLLDALSDEAAFLSNLSESSAIAANVSGGPSTIATTRFLMARLKHSIRVRSNVPRGTHKRWFSAVRKRDEAPGDSRSRFRLLSKPVGSEYADPFLFERNGAHWLFFEEVPAARTTGRLSAAKLNEDGSLGEPFVVLEKPYHLSYPMVFEHNGEVYLLPESAQAKLVELYRATDFPLKWELTSTLMKGLPLVDTTVFFQNDMWYFFTTTQGPGVETFLFSCDSLAGPWQYHPRNPICSDVRRARGAGALFVRDGKLIRPAQDCSKGYGGAIVLNEVKVLTPSEYREEPIGRIDADWSPGLLGTHTINSDSAFEVIDGVRWEQ